MYVTQAARFLQWLTGISDSYHGAVSHTQFSKTAQEVVTSATKGNGQPELHTLVTHFLVSTTLGWQKSPVTSYGKT